jgi:hypothetical protein
MIYIPIKEGVPLKTQDLLQSPLGNFYQIIDFKSKDQTIKINPIYIYSQDENNNYEFSIDRETLILAGWKKRLV